MRTRTPSLMKEDTHRALSRSISPIDSTFITSTRPYTPYPLYKQKVRTLLKPPDYSRQPPNFMSARETRSDFEKKEASLQVKLLKRTFNLMTDEFNLRSKKMNVLVSESHKVSELEHVGQHDVRYLDSYYEKLENDQDEMLGKIRNEINDNLVYRHVRERLRQTLMHLELNNQYLQSQIRAKEFLINSEHRKKIQTLEKKFTMVQACKHTLKTVRLDLKDRNLDLRILEDDIEARTKIHELRQTRLKKYGDIAENAAIEEGDLKSNNVREKLLLNIFWTKYLKFHEERMKKNSAGVFEAFKKVKIVTKISEPSEIVEKFLRKEEKLVELMNSLSDIRFRCNDFSVKNEELEEKIACFNLTQGGGIETDVRNLRIIVSEKTEALLDAQEKRNKLEVIKQNIEKWLNEMLSRVNGEKGIEKGLKQRFVIMKIIVQSAIIKNIKN